VPRAVIAVPTVTPAPEIASPIVRVPDATADTVNVVPAIVAVNEAVPPLLTFTSVFKNRLEGKLLPYRTLNLFLSPPDQEKVLADVGVSDTVWPKMTPTPLVVMTAVGTDTGPRLAFVVNVTRELLGATPVEGTTRLFVVIVYVVAPRMVPVDVKVRIEFANVAVKVTGAIFGATVTVKTLLGTCARPGSAKDTVSPTARSAFNEKPSTTFVVA